MTAPARDDPWLVLCAGIPRSGSTWLYNAARMILSHHKQEVYGAWVQSWQRDHPAPVHVVKVHEPDEDLARQAAVVLTSRRDLRDIAASALRRQWTSEAEALTFLDEVVRLHDWWRGRSDCEVAYERLVGAPEHTILSVADVLHTSLTDEQAADIRRRIDTLRFDGADDRPYDEVSLLHVDHVRDGRVGSYAEVLPAPLIARINERFADWLAKYGYVG